MHATLARTSALLRGHVRSCATMVQQPAASSLSDVTFEEGKHRRCGVVALKVGMLPLWDEWGVRHASTVLMLDECEVVAQKTIDKDGYSALQVGAGLAKSKNLSPQLLGQFKNAGVEPKRVLREFQVHPDALLPVGFKLSAQHFVPGQRIDVTGVSKGKGFAGVMKRWGFKGQPASHGNSKTHRHMGSTGQCQDPGKRWKGKKMPGRMGGVQRTQQGLQILRIDPQKDLLYVKGHVPGNRGAFVYVKDCLKRPEYPSSPPFPSFVPEEGAEASAILFAPKSDRDPMLVDTKED